MLSLCLAALLTYPATDLVIKDGDRIVMVGGALIEREQLYGHVEVMLHSMFPDKKFTVRNLGWSGDTVWGEARAGFGKPEDGYKKLIEQVKAEKPTVLIVCYGTNEAFAGRAGLIPFFDGYKRLIADVKTDAMRLVYLMPAHQVARLAKTGQEFKKEQQYNEDLSHYVGALHQLNLIYPGHFIYLQQMYETPKARDLTDDGILPNEAGYRAMAQVIAKQSGQTELAEKDLSSWEPIRQLIIRKNQLHFYKYRPQNDTYLFLFRKHEQGNNAAEIPQFDPLIAELDEKINEMKGKKK